MNDSKRTRFVVVFAAIALALYDLAVYLRVGGAATVSTAIGLWYSQPWFGPLLVLGTGFLIGHFIGMTTAETRRWLLWAVLAASAALGFYLTA